MTKQAWMIGGLAIALWACGGGGGTDSGVPRTDTGPGDTDSGPGPVDSGPTPTDTGPEPTDTGPAPTDTGPTETDGGVALAPCGPDDWVTGMTAVTIPAGTFAYSPQCLQVTAGTAVTLPADAVLHPLRSSTRGTAGTPIPMRATMNTTVTFPTPGLYPYYCENHGGDDGIGMAGVVRVE